MTLPKSNLRKKTKPHTFLKEEIFGLDLMIQSQNHRHDPVKEYKSDLILSLSKLIKEKLILAKEEYSKGSLMYCTLHTQVNTLKDVIDIIEK